MGVVIPDAVLPFYHARFYRYKEVSELALEALAACYIVIVVFDWLFD
jgi:hypothetical protein